MRSLPMVAPRGFATAACWNRLFSPHQPQFGGAYLLPDLFEMAAAYLFHIAKNHAFVDGNKRTALLACLVFLGLNGVELNRDDQRLDDAVLDVAKGTMSRVAAAAVLRDVAAGT